MSARTSAPLIVCLSASVVAGIALARPASDDPDASADYAAEYAENDVSYDYGDQAGAYGDDPYGDSGGDLAGDEPGDEQALTPVETDDGAAVGDPVSITIEGFAFESGITVAPGQTVTVVNADGAPHTLTATNDEFDTGRLSGGASGTFVAPSEPGTYDFFCAVHPSMTGTLTVAG